MKNILVLVFVAAVFSWDRAHCGTKGCTDSGIVINGMNCSEYIAVDSCNCKRIVSGLQIDMVCCASCENAMLDDCCKDRVSVDNPLDLGGGKVLTSCDMVASDYQTLCNNSLISGELGLCCETCSELGDCWNQYLVINDQYNCQQYVNLDPCHCVDTVQDIVVKDSCCDACKDVDVSGCGCRDKLSDRNIFTYKVKFSNGTEVTYNFTDCSDMVMKAPQLCNSLGDDTCCHSCQGVCVDNPFFRATFKHRKSGKKCKNCSCSEIRNFNKRVAKKACRKNKKKVADNCCAMCSEFP